MRASRMDSTDEERRFIDQIAADPDARDAPLVYADWLDEHGQTDRAALIRAEAHAGAVSGEDFVRACQRRDELRRRCTAGFGPALGEKFEFEWKRGLARVRVKSGARLSAAEVR